MGLVLPRSSGHLGTKLLRGLYKKCRAHRSKSIFTLPSITQGALTKALQIKVVICLARAFFIVLGQGNLKVAWMGLLTACATYVTCSGTSNLQISSPLAVEHTRCGVEQSARLNIKNYKTCEAFRQNCMDVNQTYKTLGKIIYCVFSKRAFHRWGRGKSQVRVFTHLLFSRFRIGICE